MLYFTRYFSRFFCVICLAFFYVLIAGCTGGVTYTDTTPSRFSIDRAAESENSNNDKNSAGKSSSDLPIRESVRHVPVPIPGQLMAIPSEEEMQNKKKKQPGEKEALENAIKKGTIKPKAEQYFNSMLVYNYMPGAVYTIYTTSGKVTDLVLQTGEKIVNVAIGDSANWIIQTSYSGPESRKTLHVLIKPSILDLADTTLTILTDRRTYHLFLRCTPNDAFMVSVKWNYTDTQGFTENENPGGVLLSNKMATTPYVGESVDVSHLDFNYSWKVTSSSKPAWLPRQVFSDGNKTYIRFPKKFKNMELPVLYLPDSNGKWTTMTNWRFMNSTTMVIDSLIRHALLKSGSVNGTQQSVELVKVVDNNN